MMRTFNTGAETIKTFTLFTLDVSRIDDGCVKIVTWVIFRPVVIR